MNIGTYRISGTGAGGIARVIGSALVVASILGTPTTSNANPSRFTAERTSSIPENTLLTFRSSETVSSTARGILAIRQAANLTWDETAKIFGVSRRSVHLWANGRHPTGSQERKLNKVLGILSAYRNLGPSVLRERLMASAWPGTLFFDLLCNGEFEVFQDRFSTAGTARPYPPPSLPLEFGSYSPQPPILLLDALQDRPVTAEKAIAKKSVRAKRQLS